MPNWNAWRCCLWRGRPAAEEKADQPIAMKNPVIAISLTQRQGPPTPHDDSSIPTSNGSASQLSLMTAYLSTLPEGVASRGKVCKVRLIRKGLLLANPTIAKRVQMIADIVSQVSVKDISGGGGHAGWAPGHVNCYLSKSGQQQLDAFVAGRGDDEAEIEQLLFWRNEASDGICEVFDIASCPRFTFISHRWAPESAALGADGELPFVLAAASEEYIWLDCCCAPQDKTNFESKNTLKVIWNIAEILDRASQVSPYYAVDGLKYQRLEAVDYSDDYPTPTLCSLSHGLRALCSYQGSLQSRHFADELASLDAKGSYRLWCMFEKRLGWQKFRVVDIKESGHAIRRRGKWHEEADNKTKRNHERNGYSLDCFDPRDVEPVTAIMYARGEFPAILDDGLPKVRLPSSELVCGIKLPVSDTNLNGWYVNSHLRPSYHINVAWPQNKPRTDRPHRIKLQLHLECLEREASPGGKVTSIDGDYYWLYDPKLACAGKFHRCHEENEEDDKEDELGFFSHEFDMPGTLRKSQCILCERVSWVS